MVDNVWTLFYRALALFYENLVDGEGQISNVIYESKPYSYKPPKADKHYRAVIVVHDVNEYKVQLEHVISEFYAAHREANKGMKGYDPTKIPRLPMYLPRINEDENIFKMQIHENKAHSSSNYKKDEMIPVISILRGTFKSKQPFDLGDGSMNEKSAKSVLEDTSKALEKEGYRVEIEDDIQNPYVIASIDAARLCEVYKCDSIQRRFFTGRQIRANFFSRVDGKLQRSKLESVGVLLVDRDIEVVHSHERTTRTDAIYTAEHPDEIVLDTIPPVLRSGRLYKKYKAR